jgi:hypothetical protein
MSFNENKPIANYVSRWAGELKQIKLKFIKNIFKIFKIRCMFLRNPKLLMLHVEIFDWIKIYQESLQTKSVIFWV